MDRGAPLLALIAGILVSTAATAAAQNPPTTPPARPDTARRDPLARELVLDEMFAVGPSALAPRIVLQGGVVYRVEVQPAQGEMSVRSVRHPSLPPLFMVPLEGGGPVGGSQIAAFLLVPRSTEEYRIDVVAEGTEPIRVRIWTDPKEMSRYARMREATRGIPTAGVSVRAVYMGAFVRPDLKSPVPGVSRATASAMGTEVCFGVVPRGAWISGRFGGCVLALGGFTRPDSAGGLWFIGTEPRYELTAPGAAIEQSLVLTVGIATTFGTAGSSRRTDYLALALGYHVATRLLGRRLYGEAEADLARMQDLGGGLEPTGTASLVPRLATGLQLRF